MGKPTIILVDDDQNILASVSMALEAAGYTVQSFSDGISALEAINNNPPDLAVLDIKMPRMDGREVLQTLRETSDLPVIFLTSLDDEDDQLLGLRLGADDYITKPFSQKLLIARIEALLRRQSLNDTPQKNTEEESITHGHLSLDPARHACSWKRQAVNLTVTEYLLLHTLAARPGHVKSRDQLIDHAYGENIYIDDRIIDSHVKRVRKKFKKIDPDFDHIETVYGIGYRYKEE